MKQNLIWLCISLVLGLVFGLWGYMLQLDNERLEARLELMAEEAESWQKSYEVLSKEHNKSMKIWADLENDRAEQEIKTREIKEKIYKRQSDEKIDSDIADSVNFINERLWDKGSGKSGKDYNPASPNK